MCVCMCIYIYIYIERERERERERPGFDSWVGKIPWGRNWQSTPVFFPRESLRTEEAGRLQSMGSQESDTT